MKEIFDTVSDRCSREVTWAYSTSFSTAVKLLAPSIRQDIYNIYGFVRLADEIVDSFHDYDKAALFGQLKSDLDSALSLRISLNPLLNAFQQTVHKYSISMELIDAFMYSMELDLTKKTYNQAEYKQYIYGSADVVGLMCLSVFVKGDAAMFGELKDSAMRLGSAFQKVNFLRDLKTDSQQLDRTYFPSTDLLSLDETSKQNIIEEIEDDFQAAVDGIRKLPIEARLGVYTAYVYYRRLLAKLKKTPSAEIMNRRIRVPDHEKYSLFAQCYLSHKLNII